MDGSFVRLKSLTLQYQLPASLIQGSAFKNVSVTLVGTNLLLLYADPDLHGQDPEFFNAGGVALPINRQATLSLRVGL